MAPTDPQREAVHALLQRHGWNATSFQVLEPGFRYWFDPLGCVAYVETRDAWVAGGAPIAAREDLAPVAARFIAAARAAGKGACFFGTEARFSELPRLQIGEQPVWDPTLWPATLAGSKSLREQLRRARAKGVVVRAVGAEELAEGAPLRHAVEALAARWLASRRMAPMGFLVDVELFGFASARRYLVAERGGALLALLAAVPVYARGGWFIEDLLRDASAPSGTAECLIDAAMRAFAAEGCRYVTLGLAPLSGDVPRVLQAVREWGAVLYDFGGVRAFKARLRPATWDPIYLAYPAGASLRAVHGALRAFAGGGLLRFGLHTVLRGPPVIVRLLALLLIPWTLALAFAAPRRWFPSPAVQAAWVAFDALLCVALLGLAGRWRAGLARALAVAISADALVTALEVLQFNLPRLAGAAEALVSLAAVVAPAFAAAVLWGALHHRAKGPA